MDLREFLTKVLHINNPELLDAGISCMRYSCYTKGEKILKTGDPITVYGFLATEGLVRGVYHTAQGKEITDCLQSRIGDCVVPSAVLDEPSPVDVEAMTDVGIIELPIAAVRKLEEKYPEVLRMENEVLTECWRQQWEMKRVRYEYDAKERYLWLCRTHPGVAELAMDKHIASFLDMTPVSLSRIRKQVALERLV